MQSLKLKAGLVILINTSLVACGGGGGNNDNVSVPSNTGGTGSTTAPYSEIRQENYAVVAAESGSAFADLTDLPDSVGALATGAELNARSLSLAEVSNKIYQRFRSKTSSLVTGVVQTIACSGGGTITEDSSQAANERISVGDSSSITANNCIEDEIGTLNGGFSVRVTSVSGDPVNSDRFSIGLATQFNNFSIRNGSDNMSVDGDMAISLRQNSTTDIAQSVSGNTLSLTTTAAGETSTARLSAYSLDETEVNGISTTTGNYVVSASSAKLGNYTYKVETRTPIVQSSSSQYPSSGAVLVQGSPATVTVTALNNSSVRVDYSAGGNGDISASRTLSWQEFRALD